MFNSWYNDNNNTRAILVIRKGELLYSIMGNIVTCHHHSAFTSTLKKY